MDTKACIKQIRFDAYLLLYELRFKERVKRYEVVDSELHVGTGTSGVDRRTSEEENERTDGSSNVDSAGYIS